LPIFDPQIQKMPFFSVIVPLYNKEKYVANAINSILAQTFTDYEVIIVEDCSTDSSHDIAGGFNSDKVRIIEHEHNKGLSAARNTGIKAASGNYIALLDADDTWRPGYLQKIYSLIRQFPQARLFATNYYEVTPGQKPQLPVTGLSLLPEDAMVANFFESGLAQPVYCSCSFCFDISVAEDIGYYNEDITFAEDVDFNIRANLAYKLAYSPEPLVMYNVETGDQITTSPIVGRVLPDLDSYERYISKQPGLKKYLDFHRYIFARYYKSEGATAQFRKLQSRIDRRSLTKRQRFLLMAPSVIGQLFKTGKGVFRKKGFRVSSFRN
jgi:glycosyltransferase involved in cell wall biosynthesis